MRAEGLSAWRGRANSTALSFTFRRLACLLLISFQPSLLRFRFASLCSRLSVLAGMSVHFGYGRIAPRGSRFLSVTRYGRVHQNRRYRSKDL